MSGYRSRHGTIRSGRRHQLSWYICTFTHNKNFKLTDYPSDLLWEAFNIDLFNYWNKHSDKKPVDSSKVVLSSRIDY